MEIYIPNTNVKWFTIHPRNHTLNSVVWKYAYPTTAPPPPQLRNTQEMYKWLGVWSYSTGPNNQPLQTHTEMCVIPHSPLEACVSRSARSKQCAQHFIHQLGLILTMFQRKDKKQNKAVKSLDYCLQGCSKNASDLLIWLWMGKAPVYNKTMFNCTSFDKNFTDKVNGANIKLSKKTANVFWKLGGIMQLICIKAKHSKSAHF